MTLVELRNNDIITAKGVITKVSKILKNDLKYSEGNRLLKKKQRLGWELLRDSLNNLSSFAIQCAKDIDEALSK